MSEYNPILVTGIERSGSTFLARIFDMCNVWSGSCNNMFENIMMRSLHFEFLGYSSLDLFPQTKNINIPVNWKDLVKDILRLEDWNKQPWMVKGGILARFWPVWQYAYPDAKWIIVRRRTADVIESCEKTGYMKLFKNPDNLEKLELKNEHDGWLWWVHQYENKFVEMIKAGLNCRVVWPDRMVYGNYQQIHETVDWLGLKWNKKIPGVIGPLLEKQKENGTSNNSGGKKNS